MVLSLGTAALAGQKTQNPQLRNLVTSYKGTEGFEIVDMGGLALSLVRAAARSAVETEEDRQAMNVFRGIKRLTVVDFSESSDHDRETFLRKVNKILAHDEMLMEAKDSGETIRIYGSSTKDENLLENIVILASEALIYVRGTIRVDQVGALMKQANQ